ncbi:farnesylcysteine lyase [Cucurbita pepo subsp. pepo]|uniref:farnesylcysteine lyase n=1 Tax=Cucurbita pepo subsp. pepo TaxID=3664 RepID=UPI000C9D424E|nr:farnesylcysteine lyase [Cucurbita pepo subsp. pepo]
MMMVRWSIIVPLFLFFLSVPPAIAQQPPPTVCIIGSGIGGSSLAHFLRQYAPSYNASVDFNIRIFERHNIVGGRMATVNVAGDTFEAGASILHPKNLHALRFTKLLNLTVKKPSSSDSFSLGIWDGRKFVFRTLKSGLTSMFPYLDKIVELWNQVVMFIRYGFSLLRMEKFVESAVEKFSKYYEGFESRPVFETVNDMLNWSGLYNLTTRTLYEELIDARLSRLLIQELVTVITRINYGQSVSISGLAGAVSLAGSGGGLWAVEGGNWQIAARLINHSDSTLHLQEEIESISYLGEYYEVKSNKGNSYSCEITVVATPLDEQNIQFTPPIIIPKRELQHTHTTFVRGLLNPGYFGLKASSKIPKLVGTTETEDVQFSSISVLKQHDDNDMTYKIFSRKPMEDTLLDKIFSVRNETIRIDWAAYPHFKAPEVFAPFILDGRHLYYVNAFENAASTMETSAVAAENIARLVLSRFFGKVGPDLLHLNLNSDRDASTLHVDL